MYSLNIAWKSIRLSNFFLPRLKMHIPKDELNGVVYSFKCPCGSEYIGESSRRLHFRILEHNRTKGTNVFNHITNCPIYNEKLNAEFQPCTNSNRREFTSSLFKPISKNLTNYHKRTRVEGIAITLNSPVLNDQVIHRSISII